MEEIRRQVGVYVHTNEGDSENGTSEKVIIIVNVPHALICKMTISRFSLAKISLFFPMTMVHNRLGEDQ